MPFVRPEHAAAVPVTTHEPAAGEDATTYAVIGLPPSLADAVHETPAVVSPAVAVTPVGALGNPSVVITADAALDAELPTLFVATTVNVYEVAFARPVHDAVVPFTTQLAPLGDDVTV